MKRSMLCWVVFGTLLLLVPDEGWPSDFTELNESKNPNSAPFCEDGTCYSGVVNIKSETTDADGNSQVKWSGPRLLHCDEKRIQTECYTKEGIYRVWRDKTPQDALAHVRKASKYMEQQITEAEATARAKMQSLQTSPEVTDAYVAQAKELRINQVFRKWEEMSMSWNPDHLNEFHTHVVNCQDWKIEVYLVPHFISAKYIERFFFVLTDASGRAIGKHMCRTLIKSPQGSFTAMRGQWWTVNQENETISYWVVATQISGTPYQVYTLLPKDLSEDRSDPQYWRTVEREYNQNVQANEW